MAEIANIAKKGLSVVGRALRETGQLLDRYGMSMMGNFAYKEELCRHRRIMPLDGVKPVIGRESFISPHSSVIGQVTLGDRVSIWYGAVLRGDVNQITVGNNSSIGDRTVVHPTLLGTDAPISIGDNVVIGEGSVLHGCTINDSVIVEPGCVVEDGAILSKNSKLSSGSTLQKNVVVPEGQLWKGAPAKFDRNLTPDEITEIVEQATQYHVLAQKHRVEHDKNQAERQHDKMQKVFHLTDEVRYRDTPF